MFKSKTINRLGVGDLIPSFTLADQNGREFRIADVIGKEIIVLFFYPKDDTPGCTKEACSFRDSYEYFSDAGARVIGISNDSAESHRSFADKYKLSYTLLSDSGNKVRKAFGVPGDIFGLIPGRVTYVIDHQGVIRSVFNSQIQAEKHVEESLRAIIELK